MPVREKSYLTYEDSLWGYEFVEGRRIETDHVDFSFYYNYNPDFRFKDIVVKIYWERDTWHSSKDLEEIPSGWMHLSGDYKYEGESPSEDREVSAKLLEQARAFFRKYKVLFVADWYDERGIIHSVARNYLCGYCSRYYKKFYKILDNLWYGGIADDVEDDIPVGTRKDFLRNRKRYKKRAARNEKKFLRNRRRFIRKFAQAKSKGAHSDLPGDLQNFAILEDTIRQQKLFDMCD